MRPPNPLQSNSTNSLPDLVNIPEPTPRSSATTRVSHPRDRLSPPSSPPNPPRPPDPDTRLERKVRSLELSNASLRSANAALERTRAQQAAELSLLRARLAPSAAAAPPPGAGAFSLADRLRPVLDTCFPCFHPRSGSPDHAPYGPGNPDEQAGLLVDYDGRPASSVDPDPDGLFRPAHHRAHAHPDLISLHSRLADDDGRTHPFPLEPSSSTLSRWELLGSWLSSTLCPASHGHGRLALADVPETADDAPLPDELAPLAGPSSEAQPKRPSRHTTLELVSPQYARSGTSEHAKKRTRHDAHRPASGTASTAGSDSASGARWPAKKRARGAPEDALVVVDSCAVAFPAAEARRRGPRPADDGQAQGAVSSPIAADDELTSARAGPGKPDHGPDKGLGAAVVQLVLVALAVRLGTLLLLLGLPRLGLVPCFDCSARLRHAAVEGLVRWDTLHFVAMGLAGRRTVEQDWAFGRGIVWVGRLGAWVTSWSGAAEAERIVVGAALAAVLASVGSSVALFLLTLETTRSLRFASLAGFLHVFSPSPSTQVVPYTEPFYALLSFGGMYLFVRSNRASARLKRVALKAGAGVLAGAATGVRAIGVLQCVFWWAEWWRGYEKIIFSDGGKWNQVMKKQVGFNEMKKLLRSLTEPILLSMITCLPFLFDQWVGYLEYCGGSGGGSGGGGKREWCGNRVPSIYNFVQHHYWDVGFLRYWRIAQSPLFLLSGPLYYISIKGIMSYYKYQILKSRHGRSSRVQEEGSEERPFVDGRVAGHVHLQLVLTILLLVNSHVQIVLRQAATMPALWWALADLVGLKWEWWGYNGSRRDRGGGMSIKTTHWWFHWTVLWGCCSVILWAGFYPPA